MKRLLLVVCCVQWSVVAVVAQSDVWKPVAGKIMTPWAEQVDPARPLPEYPRPQMVREPWLNLNGLWDYAILPKGAAVTGYQGKILVPFAPESALSGVGEKVGSENAIQYRRTVTLPRTFRSKRVLLHFGAVDWKCDVFVNGKTVGSHTGGYDPFFFDITDALKRSGEQEIMVRVWDPTDDGPQPRGKQVKNPHGIWYTPVTGIWQTVWIEAVPETHIESIRITPDIDKNTLSISAVVREFDADHALNVSVWEGTKKVAEQSAPTPALTVEVPNARRWSPEDPFLYDLRITITNKGKTVDEVRSYAGMRKIAMGPDANGVQRMWLNDEPVFQYGPLDQGWWPDGLYTAPTDEALKFDIRKTQEMGFNMIRKHVKVEPARWYHHCDRLGMLVWQDMPSGDLGNRWESRPGVIGKGTEKQRSAGSEEMFRKEWKAIMDANFNFPSIVVWVPFNEAWGQFKTKEIVEWTMSYDPSRLVNAASGGNFYNVGHILDMHNYPDPVVADPDLYGDKQILVLGEYGGLGLPVEGHTWQDKDNWGYQNLKTADELYQRYQELVMRIPDLIRIGLSAAVYTQTTDVEIETNGLMTYDRRVIKMNEERLRTLHQKLYDPALIKK